MSTDKPTVIKVLVINAGIIGESGVKTEKFEFPVSEKDLARQTVLNVMNRMGKNSEAIVKLGAQWFMYSHTAARGPSKELYRSAITYHPLMGELA